VPEIRTLGLIDDSCSQPLDRPPETRAQGRLGDLKDPREFRARERLPVVSCGALVGGLLSLVFAMHSQNTPTFMMMLFVGPHCVVYMGRLRRGFGETSIIFSGVVALLWGGSMLRVRQRRKWGTYEAEARLGRAVHRARFAGRHLLADGAGSPAH